MFKKFLFLFFLILLSNCSAPGTAFLGPVFTGAKTGSISQATLSYSSGQIFEQFQSKNLPTMPIGAKFLMEKYQIPEGKSLGTKLKIIEEEWVENDFNLSEKEIHKILSR